MAGSAALTSSPMTPSLTMPATRRAPLHGGCPVIRGDNGHQSSSYMFTNTKLKPSEVIPEVLISTAQVDIGPFGRQFQFGHPHTIESCCPNLLFSFSCSFPTDSLLCTLRLQIGYKAFTSIRWRKDKQDNALSEHTKFLGDLEGMGLDIGSEIDWARIRPEKYHTRAKNYRLCAHLYILELQAKEANQRECRLVRNIIALKMSECSVVCDQPKRSEFLKDQK
ncbi:hypothetical protein TRIUR3_10123 [Triticum urartu]|uniref:Uncharacterized protein n=1 Tax=Triticum urartu TaxID=4572 RepID=M8A688_TRIUA|nr:hypothetical protein TRIUR3_10123 [Triticum urartu]